MFNYLFADELDPFTWVQHLWSFSWHYYGVLCILVNKNHRKHVLRIEETGRLAEVKVKFCELSKNNKSETSFSTSQSIAIFSAAPCHA